MRYAYSSDPAATLYNKEGLPASPFQTYLTDITDIANKEATVADVGGKKQAFNSIKVFDVAGHCVVNIPGNSRQEVMPDVSGVNSLVRFGRFSKGVYIVQLRSGDDWVISRKIVQQ